VGGLTSLSRRAVVGGLAGLCACTLGLAMVNGCVPLPSTQPRVARVGSPNTRIAPHVAAA
jgi:hypothetical protein